MTRVFVPSEYDLSDRLVVLPPDDSAHVARVLRLRTGDALTVCDGAGGDYPSEIISLQGGLVTVRAGARIENQAEPRLFASLLLGIAKGDRMDYALQKAVEAGAGEIRPFVSARCIAKPKENKHVRWQRIVQEAAAQSGRGRIPIVHLPVPLTEALAAADHCDARLFCYEDESQTSLRQALETMSPFASAALVTGPEGGFSPEEAQTAARQGYRAVSLGRRILRCETAPVAALSALLYHAGEM